MQHHFLQLENQFRSTNTRNKSGYVRLSIEITNNHHRHGIGLSLKLVTVHLQENQTFFKLSEN